MQPKPIFIVILVVVVLFGSMPANSQTQEQITIQENIAWIDFPESVDFHLEASGELEIVNVQHDQTHGCFLTTRTVKFNLRPFGNRFTIQETS